MVKTREQKIFPEPTQVVIGLGEEARTFFVAPLVRRRFKKLFKILGDIVEDLASENPDIDLNNLQNSVGTIVATAGDKLGEIYAFVLVEDTKDNPATPERIAEMVDWIDDNMLPNQEMDLLAATFEQNDMEAIVKNFQKMVGAFKK